MKRRIICAFQFFNELDILKIKLEELNDVVDFFIISESNKTHSNKPKQLYFENNKDLFKKFKSKIIHQVLLDTPNDYINLKNDSTKDARYNHVIDVVNNHTHYPKDQVSYGNDSYEKESLYQAMNFAKLDDMIILGDCDEIPKASKLQEIIDNFDDSQIYHMQHSMYYYYLNLRKNEPWHGNMVMTYKMFKEHSFCEMRQFKEGIFVDNAGWHFTYMGGREAVRNKIESFGEQSLNLDWVKNGLENSINNAIERGRDLYNRPCKFWVENISYDTHPKYLVEHQDQFSEYIRK
jgi:beta-1,4-mannosyl-glycoprotein beta-1,4-N-acetylglucosaminyltransferase